MSGTGVHQTPPASVRGVPLGGIARIRPGRFGRPSIGTVDLVTMLAIAALTVVEWLLPSELHRADPVRSLVIQLLTVAPVAVRHRAPVVALAVTSAVIGLPTLVMAHDLSFWGTLLPLGLLHYVLVRQRSWRTAMSALLVPVGGVGLYVWLTPAMHGDLGLPTFFVIIFGSSTLAGRLVRRDAERREQLAAALERLAETEEDRHRLAVLDERTALARDLHDVVAQALSVMNVSARTARSALPGDLAAASAAVRLLESAGRDATADLRRMLGLLRSADGVEPTAPAPGLAQLPALLDRMRSAGLRIEVDDRRTGSPTALPAGFEVAVLRVVQEALTNTLRHAGPTAVTVRLAYLGDDADRATMIIDVVDRGPRDGSRPAPTTEPGRHGLVGMSERVALYGGTLRTGPEGSGFAVRVTLPVPLATPVAA